MAFPPSQLACLPTFQPLSSFLHLHPFPKVPLHEVTLALIPSKLQPQSLGLILHFSVSRLILEILNRSVQQGPTPFRLALLPCALSKGFIIFLPLVFHWKAILLQ